MEKTQLTLIIWNLVARFVHARKAEVTILAHLAVFSAVYNHGCVACGTELFTVCILDFEADRLAAEPVTLFALACSVHTRDACHVILQM
jgi:hypothetical protein